MKHVQLYSDGACSGNPGVGGWGFILIYNNIKKSFSGAEPDTTNNRMELKAVINGLNLLKQPCNVDVFSDSAYVTNAFILGWINNWIKNNWIGSDGKKIKNYDLWLDLYNLSCVHNIKWFKVKGHSDNELNNQCDKLATDAIKIYKQNK